MEKGSGVVRRWRVRVLVGALVAVGLLPGLLYLYLAWPPVDAGRMEKEAAQARGRVQTLLEMKEADERAGAGVAVSDAPKALDVAAKPAESTESVGAAKEEAGKTAEVGNPEKWDVYLKLMQVQQERGLVRLLESGPLAGLFVLYSIPNMDVSLPLPEGAPFSAASMARADVEEGVLSRVRSQFEWRNDSQSAVDAMERLGETTSATLMASYLDDLERVLIDKSRWDNTFAPVRYQSPWDISMGIAGGTCIAMQRAMARGDQEKAVLLMERYLDHAQASLIRSFPSSDRNHFCSPACGMLLRLAGEKGMSAEALARLQRAIDGKRLKPEEVKAIRTAHAEWVKEELLRQDAPVKIKDNTWHFMFGGKAEKTVAKAFQPLWREQVERMAAAWSEGNIRGMLAAERQVAVLRLVQNRGDSLLERFLPDWRSEERVYGKNGFLRNERILREMRAAGESCNDTVDFARLALAAGRFHRDTGRWPTSMADLAPRYVDVSGMNTERAVWVVYRLPAFRYTVQSHPDMGMYMRPAEEGKVRNQEETAVVCKAVLREWKGNLPAGAPGAGTPADVKWLYVEPRVLMVRGRVDGLVRAMEEAEGETKGE